MYNFLKITTFICNIFSHLTMFGEKIEFFIFNSIYHDYNKNCEFDQKMVKIGFLDLFETNHFVS